MIEKSNIFDIYKPEQTTRHFGFFRGIVINNIDPLKLGRLQINVFSLYNSIEKTQLPWAEPCFQFGGFENIEGIPYNMVMDPINNSQIKASPRDIFLQLISIIALYGSVIALLTLLFQMINILIPDAIANYYNSYRYNGTARGAIAALIVFFPMFLWTVRTLAVEYKIDESRKRLSIRKWLLHFTLFIAALVIATDFITLIYNFLNGDLTLKFTLKIFSVLIVALLVFWYYRNEIKETTKEITRYVGYIVSISVFLAIVGGIFVTGSPFEARPDGPSAPVRSRERATALEARLPSHRRGWRAEVRRAR